jgi:hypothetical protein
MNNYQLVMYMLGHYFLGGLIGKALGKLIFG